MLVAKIEDNKITYINGTYKHGRDVSLELNLEKGIYLVTVEVDWQ